MRKYILLLLFLSSAGLSRAQFWGGGVDEDAYHFGFTFQYVSSELKILKNKNWRDPFYDTDNNAYVTDSLSALYSKTSPGFGLGFVVNYRLGEHADIRLTPTMVFNDRLAFYEYEQTTVNFPSQKKTIQSTMAELPLGIKIKSDRRKNFRAYLLAGAKYSIDIASKKKTDDEGFSLTDKYLKTKRSFFSYETAIGFDLYFEYFKLSPEFKLSYSVNDILIHDPHPYAAPIDKMMLRHFTFSLFVE